MNLYSFIRAIFKYPMKFVFRVHVSGAQNIPADEGFVLCANHTSMCDVIVLAVAMDRQIRYMAKKEVLRVPVVGAFLRSLGAFAVDRGAADVGAIKKAASIIEDGGVVCMFPQGHRYPKVAVRSTAFRSGVGLVAYRAGCGIMPAYISTPSGRVRFFRRTDIVFGEFIPNSELCFENGGNGEYKNAAQLLFGRICDIGVKAGAPLEIAAAEDLSGRVSEEQK